jgi:hypothetical protein
MPFVFAKLHLKTAIARNRTKCCFREASNTRVIEAWPPNRSSVGRLTQLAARQIPASRPEFSISQRSDA